MLLYSVLFAVALMGYAHQTWIWVPIGAAGVFLLLINDRHVTVWRELAGDHSSLRAFAYQGSVLHALVGSTAAYLLGLLVRFAYPV